MTLHSPLPAAGSADTQPWQPEDGRGAGAASRRVLLLASEPGRLPPADRLSALGIEPILSGADIAGIEPGSPLLEGVDAVVAELVPGNDGALPAFERLVQSLGHVPVIAAVDGLSVADTRMLLRSGAFDVLPLPFTADELAHAVADLAKRPVRPQAAAARQPQRQGKVVSFLSALGGVGSTALATQAGILWSSDARVCYIDLDVQFGNAALLLDLKPSLHLGNLIEDAERLDPDLLQSVAVSHGSGLSVIASPLEMMPIDAIDTDFIDRILRVASQTYDLVIVDLPTLWTEWTVRVLQRSDAVCMISNLSVAGMHQTRRQLEMVEANGLMPKLKLVANRVNKSFLGKVDLKENEAVLGRKIEFTIANDYPAVSGANDEGRALKEVKPGSRVLKDLKYLTSTLSVALAAEGDAQ